MKQLSQFALAAALGLAYAPASLAGNAHSHAHGDHAVAAMSEGEVRKVDKNTGKLTIQHGPLQNLGMPGMTMAFSVKDAAMLAQVKAGDKIRFVAEKVGTALTVTQLETVK